MSHTLQPIYWWNFFKTYDPVGDPNKVLKNHLCTWQCAGELRDVLLDEQDPVHFVDDDSLIEKPFRCCHGCEITDADSSDSKTMMVSFSSEEKRIKVLGGNSRCEKRGALLWMAPKKNQPNGPWDGDVSQTCILYFLRSGTPPETGGSVTTMYVCTPTGQWLFPVQSVVFFLFSFSFGSQKSKEGVQKNCYGTPASTKNWLCAPEQSSIQPSWSSSVSDHAQSSRSLYENT